MPRHRAVVIDTDEGQFQVHLGMPGRPRVYRQRGRTIRRVKDDDPVLNVVAEAMAAGMRRKREEARRRELELARRRKWWVRALRWLGAMSARWVYLAEGHGP